MSAETEYCPGRIRQAYASIFLFDQARPVEWLSLISLFGWVWQILKNPQLLERDSYVSFSSLPPQAWAVLMALIALVQLLVMFKVNGRFAHELRFAAMTLTASIWTVIAVNFWGSGISTTANITYSALAFVTALTGIYLGWKTQSYS